ncbi:MAG: tryptophan--tRNA ligase [Verrucomicrobia bacterium]|nr:tryptophan--tRNA ligase [Verrucomicrobiota bacterium]
MSETSEKKPAKPVVLTCAQPTGRLHLGNYLGAVLNWGRMQDDHECYFGIVDQHAITVPYVPAQLRENTYSCLAQYVASGLDPARSRLFVQSHVIGHTELAWILGCLCPLGQLERMTQFKDKSRKQESVDAGLLFYPVLMAADILLYNAALVPVGDDQKQHLELARDLAEKFNHRYSDTFKVPEPFISKVGSRIMSLQDPTAKMSKSDPNHAATVFITDRPEEIRKKIMSAVTDSSAEVRAGADKPGVTNLLSIMSACTGRSVATLEAEFAGKGYGDFKKAVADAVVAMLDPVRLRYDELIKDRGELDRILKAGAEQAQATAFRTLSKVHRKAGFVERPR